MSIDRSKYMGYFLDFSAEVTAFSTVDLQGTGQADLYFDTICGKIGEEIFQELLEKFHELDERARRKHNPTIFTEGLDSEILASAKRGPVACNIIKLWYIATWEKMPETWHYWYGTGENGDSFIPSPQAYPEGLVWKAIGVNPPGAKAPGYGTWSEPPSVSLS